MINEVYSEYLTPNATDTVTYSGYPQATRRNVEFFHIRKRTSILSMNIKEGFDGIYLTCYMPHVIRDASASTKVFERYSVRPIM